MEGAPLACHSWHGPYKYYFIPLSSSSTCKFITPATTGEPNTEKGKVSSRVFLCCASPSSTDQRGKVDIVFRITPEGGSADETLKHPWDPHKPSLSPALPKPARPYPSFEGWFLRLADFDNGVSVGVIMATNYATAESQATLLFSFCSDTMGSTFEPGRTYSVYARSKDSKFIQLPRPENAKDEQGNVVSHEPIGFEWEFPHLGRIVAHPHETFMDVNVEGYKFKTHMVNEVLWDSHDSEKGPEGWARRISILPTHWYVYSLGSQASYELSNQQKGLSIKGRGLAHQEKNWGETFPAGHVWMQAFRPDNKAQVVLSGAYFKVGDNVKMPYVFAMGYRSPQLNIDMRTNDPGVLFKDFEILPLEGRFSVKAIGPSHTLQICCSAPSNSFSEPILCPIGKLRWEPACRESYCAKLEIDVYEHAVWGVIGDSKLIARQAFDCAGLEFGEDLLREAEN